jgi:hypothetical protein
MRSLLLTLAALAALLSSAPAQSLVTPIKNPKLSGTLDVSGLSATTGSGNLVLATSPTLTTPVLGAAAATSLNGLTLTTSTGTITITNAKTLAVTNTLTLTGTDGSTLNIGAGGTLGTAAYTATTAYAAAPSGTTGSGNLVYATSPTLVTPTLGAATATTLSAVNVTATGTLTGAGSKLGYAAKTATYTILRTDFCVNCTSGTFTVTLPTAVGFAGEIHVVKNSGAGTITLACTLSETIDAVATKSIAAGTVRRVMSDGANWIEL